MKPEPDFKAVKLTFVSCNGFPQFADTHCMVVVHPPNEQLSREMTKFFVPLETYNKIMTLIYGEETEG